MENEEQKIERIDTEALKKELEGFIAVAKKEKEKIEALAVNISTKSEEIELYYTTFSESRNKLTDSDTGMQALLNQATNIKNQVDQVGTNAQSHLDQITEKFNAINTKIQEIESYYGTFTELKNKLSDGQTGLQALLDQSTTLKNNIDQLNTDAQEALEQINNKSISVIEKVQDIEIYYTASFLPLKEKIDDEKTGLQALLGSATNLKDEIIKTKAGTDENFREIKNLNDQSLKLKEQSEKSKNEIDEFKKRSAEFKADIEQTFQIATDVSLANSFNERKKDLEKESAKWLKHLSWSTGALSLIVIGIYLSQYISNGNKPSDWKFWYRFVFTSPVIFYITFASHNYNKVRDLLEKYAFKFATSLSLQSYTKLLTDNFKDQDKAKLLDFSIRTIDMVYKEPYIEKNKARKFNFGNKVINIGLEDMETLAKENINITDIVNEKIPTEEK